MRKTQVIDVLIQQYDFSKEERDILRYLTEAKATAETILQNTTVSNGRIYKLLADLEAAGLISKENSKPAIYSMEPFREHIVRFLDTKLKASTVSQKEVLEAVTAIEDNPSAEVIYGSKKSFDMEIIKMNESCKWLKLIHKSDGIPWFFYAFFPEEDFFKVRNYMAKKRTIGSSAEEVDLLQKRSSYIDLYLHKNVEHIMHQNTFENYLASLDTIFGKKATDYKKIIDDSVKTNSRVKIYLSKNLNSPFSVYVYDKGVIMPIFTSKTQDRLMRMQGSEFINIYGEYFSSFKNNSVACKNLSSTFDDKN